MKRPFLVICVPGIVAVAILIALTPYRLHPDFTSEGTIAVQEPDNAAFQSSTAGRTGVAYRRIRWDELVPAQWDPKQLFKGEDISSWGDADPRALTLQRRMQTAWNSAPINQALDGRAVRTAGYVVPIDESRDGVREFLLVPYFGSCIHIPPPPANQIIDVSSPKPVKWLHSMDAVWVSGVLSVARAHHDMGDSSYALKADAVDLYTGPSQ
jgi:hypothetical protein